MASKDDDPEDPEWNTMTERMMHGAMNKSKGQSSAAGESTGADESSSSSSESSEAQSVMQEGLSFFERRVLDRLNIPNQEKQLELILALRDAASYKAWFKSLKKWQQVLVVGIPLAIITTFLLTIYGIQVAAVYAVAEVRVQNPGVTPVLIHSDVDSEGTYTGMGATKKGDPDLETSDPKFIVGTANVFTKRNLLDYPKLSNRELENLLDLSFSFRGALHYFKISGFIKYSESHLLLLSGDGSEIRVQNGAVYLKRPFEQQVVVEEARSGKLMVAQEL